jgi:MFS family permease
VASWLVHTRSGVKDPFFDAYYYWRMAQGQRTWAPFGYRILAPGVVRAMPLGTDVGFVVVTAVAIAVLAGVSYAWLSRHVPPVRAVAGVAILCSSTAVLGSLRVPYGTDVTMLALIAICAWAADQDRWLAFTLAAVAAVLTREAAVVLTLVPLAAFVRERDRRALVAVVAPALGLLAVQDLVQVYPRPLQQPSEVFGYLSRHYGGISSAVVVAVAMSFGAAWLLVPMAWSRLDATSKSWALVAVGSIPLLLIATAWGRLMAPGFVLVAIAAVRAPVRTWGLYGVAFLIAVTSFAPDNLPLAASTLVLGVGVVLVARTPLRERDPRSHATSAPPQHQIESPSPTG